MSFERIKEEVSAVKIELENANSIFFFFVKSLAKRLKKVPTGPCKSKTFLPLNSSIFSFKFIPAHATFLNFQAFFAKISATPSYARLILRSKKFLKFRLNLSQNLEK